MTKVFDHAEIVEDDFLGDAPIESGLAQKKKRHPFRNAFGGLGIALLVLVGAVTGWGYLKFRAIPKIKIDKAVLGQQEQGQTTVAYEDLFFETSETGSTVAQPEASTTVPQTAPTVPGARADAVPSGHILTVAPVRGRSPSAAARIFQARAPGRTVPHSSGSAVLGDRARSGSCGHPPLRDEPIPPLNFIF